MEKVSLVIPVLNEENTLSTLLTSLNSQIRRPDEVIFVDGGSKDETVKILKRWKVPFNVEILQVPGNIASARNIGIRAAKHAIIAVTDAGCILDPHWLERLVAPFSQKKIDVVAGYYLAHLPLCGERDASSIFQKCLATYTSVMPDKLGDDFLPSSRSMAFRKKTWQQVGGYPEQLDTAEDLVFARNLRAAGMHMKIVRDAVVYWPQKRTWKEAFVQLYRYAQGDGQALYIRPRTPLLWVRVVTAAAIFGYVVQSPTAQNLTLLAAAFVVYSAFAIMKNISYVPVWQSLFILPGLQIMSDIAVPLGMISGFIRRQLQFQHV